MRKLPNLMSKSHHIYCHLADPAPYVPCCGLVLLLAIEVNRKITEFVLYSALKLWPVCTCHNL